jgi:hypothetical protein
MSDAEHELIEAAYGRTAFSFLTQVFNFFKFRNNFVIMCVETVYLSTYAKKLPYLLQCKTRFRCLNM